MAAPPVRSFAFFQISPVVKPTKLETMSAEELSRLNVSTYVHQRVNSVRLIHEKVYRGYASRLQQGLADWTREASCSEGIVCITCHGQLGTGRFRDHTGDNEEIRYWTAEALWNGFSYVLGQHAHRFDGLCKLLSNAPYLRSIIVVLAPCYGAYFADALRQCVQQKPCDRNVMVEVAGLSYGKTYRRPEPNPIVKERKPATYSYDLMEWFQSGCRTPATGHKPKNSAYAGPGGDAVEEPVDTEPAPTLV